MQLQKEGLGLAMDSGGGMSLPSTCLLPTNAVTTTKCRIQKGS